MADYTIIENVNHWNQWVHKEYPSQYERIIQSPIKFPCLVRHIEYVDVPRGWDVYLNIVYLEEAQALIAHYWDKKEANNYPDSEGFELVNDCNN